MISGDLAEDANVRIGGGSFTPGEEATVTVSMPGTYADATSAFWGVGEFTFDEMSSDSFDPEWMSWTPGGNIIALSETEPGEFEGSFVVPEFVDGEQVTIMAGYMDAAGIPHYFVKTANRDSGGISMMLIIGIIAIIGIVAVAIIIIKMR